MFLHVFSCLHVLEATIISCIGQSNVIAENNASLNPMRHHSLSNPWQYVLWRKHELPFSDGAVEFQTLDGHSGPPVAVLCLEYGAEAPPAQVVQVCQLLVGNHRQVAGQVANVHTALSRVRLHIG